MRARFSDMQKREARKAGQQATTGQPREGLPAWRDVVTPHPDVRSGEYSQAEFAADLAQVLRGDASREYANPKEFFRRTHITEGLGRLLTSAIKRVSGRGGDPIVELQTNFGGGKTHSLLALYHLFSDEPAANLAGVDRLLKELGIEKLPDVQRAVLVGTALPPGEVQTMPDGTEIRTLWGLMAWKLAGREGFEILAESDRQGVNPGSDRLVEVFRKAGPCLVLIDEWVAHSRNLYGVSGLAAGSFDANMSFAQSLTEAVKAHNEPWLLVATLPASDIEIGGEGGREALTRLSNTFGRSDTDWRSATTHESYEIVRRRLFEPIDDSELYAKRDAVVQAFGDLYRKHTAEFPSECREGDYEREIASAYPIHPEFFARLYEDWASLEQFQRTRGVLRLMARVIYTLWSGDDRSLLILPSMTPIGDPAVQEELTRYLEAHWTPVIERDVDGEGSLPLKVDNDNPNLGRYAAARRVARTIYLGSAPIVDASRKGIDDRRVKLGCVQPGEPAAVFGDAIRHLTDQATHLYADGTRYWYSTQPNVTRTAKDRAAQQKEDVVLEEIKKWLRAEQRHRGDFARVHPAPASSHDVTDEQDARLVVLGPEHPHVKDADDSPALELAKELLESRGSGPRMYRNTLVFLAADKTRLGELDQAVRDYLAWSSIHEEREELDLNNYQRRQAENKLADAKSTVERRIPEAWQWLLVPEQPEPQGPVEWDAARLQGNEHLAPRAAKRLERDGTLMSNFGGQRLRAELDRIPLWRGEHVGLKQLTEDFAQYLYLPRIKTSDLVVQAVREGVGFLNWEETFAYAGAYDQKEGRYQGLQAGEHPSVIVDNQAVVVHPDADKRQHEADRAAAGETGSAGAAEVREHGPETDSDAGSSSPTGGGPTQQAPARPTRFHATVSLDTTRPGRNAAQIADEVIAHLTSLPRGSVKVTLEIEAETEDGVDENTQRTVTENCRTLNFENHEFHS